MKFYVETTSTLTRFSFLSFLIGFSFLLWPKKYWVYFTQKKKYEFTVFVSDSYLEVNPLTIKQDVPLPIWTDGRKGQMPTKYPLLLVVHFSEVQCTDDLFSGSKMYRQPYLSVKWIKIQLKRKKKRKRKRIYCLWWFLIPRCKPSLSLAPPAFFTISPTITMPSADMFYLLLSGLPAIWEIKTQQEEAALEPLGLPSHLHFSGQVFSWVLWSMDSIQG